MDTIVRCPIYGDYRQPNPTARIIGAVADGEVDIAAVWGPLAGYFPRRSPTALKLVQITDTAGFAPLLFQFDIAIGVRKGDDERRQAFDRLISRNSVQIARIRERYGVPMAEPRAGPDRLDPAK